jgi:nitroalkane oxidase
MLGTVLGLLPILFGGTSEQAGRLLKPFLKKNGAPLAGFCSTEPGGSANAGSPLPGEGVRTVAERKGDNWIINGRKKWVSSATGWDRKGADVLCVVCRTDANAPPEKGISIVAVQRPAPGIVFERAIESVGHRACTTPNWEGPLEPPHTGFREPYRAPPQVRLDCCYLDKPVFLQAP